MVAFYNQQDQDIYTGGQHYIPQQYYRLNYTPPEVMGPSPDLSATNVIPPYPLPNQGGGGGGGLGSLGGMFGNLDLGKTKTFNKNVFKTTGPVKGWDMSEITGYYDPQTNTYKTWEGKNIDHAGLFTGKPKEGDIEGTGFQFPSIMGGIVQWLKNKTQGVKDKFTGGKDEVIDQTIVTGTNQEGDKGTHSWDPGPAQGTSQGSHWDAGNQEPSGDYQFADYKHGGRAGFFYGGLARIL